jgi:hypothetical protein
MVELPCLRATTLPRPKVFTFVLAPSSDEMIHTKAASKFWHDDCLTFD